LQKSSEARQHLRPPRSRDLRPGTRGGARTFAGLLDLVARALRRDGHDVVAMGWVSPAESVHVAVTLAIPDAVRDHQGGRKGSRSRLDLHASRGAPCRTSWQAPSGSKQESRLELGETTVWRRPVFVVEGVAGVELRAFQVHEEVFDVRPARPCVQLDAVE